MLSLFFLIFFVALFKRSLLWIYRILPIFLIRTESVITDKLKEEKMPVYIRLGIRLYKGATIRVKGGRGLMFPLVSYSLFFSDFS